MKRDCRVRLLGLAAPLLASLAWPAMASDKWIKLQTKNFNVVSSASERQTRDLALKLEQFRYVFFRLFDLRSVEAMPSTVVVFKNDGSFKPFKPLYNGKPANVAGYFQRGRDENIIALNISANQERPLSVIYHEYTHLLTSYTEQPWPAWLMEGVAELYSTFQVDENKVTLGTPIASHVEVLRTSQLLPLHVLLSVDPRSPVYNERDKQSIFYAESWALAHYLMMSDRQSHRPELVKFIDLTERGENIDRAFAEAFKKDYVAMEQDLRRYVGQSVYPIVTYTFKSMDWDSQVKERPLEAAELQYYLGDLLFRTKRVDEAAPFFKQAEAMDPNLPYPYEGLGMIAEKMGNYSIAKEELKKAAERGSTNYLAHYYYAEALIRDEPGGPSLEVARTAAEELKTSIKLMPSFAYSYMALGQIYLSTGEHLPEAEAAMLNAVALEPQAKQSLITLALIQVRLQETGQARKTLEPLLQNNVDPALRRSAESIIEMLDQHHTSRVDSPETGRP